MLILPLHKPLNRHNFPVVTMLLAVVNVLVFFGWQAGDARALEQAQRYYVGSGLARYELPAYEQYLQQDGEGKRLARFREQPRGEQVRQLARASATDVRFIDALQGTALIADPQRQDWLPLRARYDTMLGKVFTLRHMLRSSEWSPQRMLTAAFLHGDVMHLLGNMIFLLAIGVLLEGAIGPWRFLAVYLLGAMGSSAASLWWRWGEEGGGLGASGAIAALMGAFCVVWGRQPVRFFYWVGVVFDYVRAPAIWLFPAWLGWELFNLLATDKQGIGFDAHAGGLICGALIGAALVATRQVRPQFIAEVPVQQRIDDRWERARRHLGRMENRQAESLLAELAAERPQNFDIALARYRAASNAGGRDAGERAMDLLRLRAGDADQVQAQLELLRQPQAAAGVPADVCEALLSRWIELGQLHGAETLLREVPLPPGGQARHWFRLALAHGARLDEDARRRILQQLAEGHPELPQGQKARFLLDNA